MNISYSYSKAIRLPDNFAAHPLGRYHYLLGTLIGLAKDRGSEEQRLDYYRLIRAQTGLDFSGWQDEPQLWFDFLLANDAPKGEVPSPRGQQYTVIGWDGSQRYLLLRHDRYSTKSRPRGQILNLKRPTLSDVFDLAVLEADGHWQPAPPVDAEWLMRETQEAYKETLGGTLHTLPRER